MRTLRTPRFNLALFVAGVVLVALALLAAVTGEPETYQLAFAITGAVLMGVGTLLIALSHRVLVVGPGMNEADHGIGLMQLRPPFEDASLALVHSVLINRPSHVHRWLQRRPFARAVVFTGRAFVAEAIRIAEKYGVRCFVFVTHRISEEVQGVQIFNFSSEAERTLATRAIKQAINAVE